MWGICRINLLGTEILCIEIGHQPSPPELAKDDNDEPSGITGGSSQSGFERRGIEDVRDTAGWLPIGFTQ